MPIEVCSPKDKTTYVLLVFVLHQSLFYRIYRLLGACQINACHQQCDHYLEISFEASCNPLTLFCEETSNLKRTD